MVVKDENDGDAYEGGRTEGGGKWMRMTMIGEEKGKNFNYK